MEQLRQEKLEIDQQLRSIHGSSLGSIQSLSMSRRNDRGYSSDMDGGSRGGRGGGGGMRGGRGGGGRGGRGGPPGGGGRPNDNRYNAGDYNTNNNNSVDKHKTLGNVRAGARGPPPTTNGRPAPRGTPRSNHRGGGGGGGGSSSSGRDVVVTGAGDK